VDFSVDLRALPGDFQELPGDFSETPRRLPGAPGTSRQDFPPRDPQGLSGASGMKAPRNWGGDFSREAPGGLLLASFSGRLWTSPGLITGSRVGSCRDFSRGWETYPRGPGDSEATGTSLRPQGLRAAVVLQGPQDFLQSLGLSHGTVRPQRTTRGFPASEAALDSRVDFSDRRDFSKRPGDFSGWRLLQGLPGTHQDCRCPRNFSRAGDFWGPGF
jgi:hypothetical protein